jgi:hypothetical protein
MNYCRVEFEKWRLPVVIKRQQIHRPAPSRPVVGYGSHDAFRTACTQRRNH